MDADLADQVADIAQRVVASGAISANGHGNVSVRVPGAQEMYFTAGPSLRGHPASAVVRVGLDGTLQEGDLPPNLPASAPSRCSARWPSTSAARAAPLASRSRRAGSRANPE
jgi:hypothetical protein